MICENQAWMFQNQVTEPSLGNVLYPNRNDSLTLEIFGADGATGTIVFEGQGANKTAWYAVSGVRLSDLSVASTTSVLGSMWSFDLTGLYAFRARVSAATVGVTVVGKVVNTHE